MSDRRQLNLDRDRVTVLLLINALLIKKAYSLYAGVLSNQQTFQQMPPQSRQAVLEQFNNVNRRLQCNLGVLLYISDSYHNKAAAQQPNRFQFPVILSTPPEMPELRQLYKRLQDLYPEAIQFLKSKIQHMKQDQQQQQNQNQNQNRNQITKTQLQQQMPMLSQPKGYPPQQHQNHNQNQNQNHNQNQQNASPFNFDINQMGSPQSFDSNLIGLPRGQMGNAGKTFNPNI